MNKVRFGIIGCGVIAPNHAKSLLGTPETELVAVCDIIEEKAADFAQKFGVKDYYKDYNDLLKRDDIDAVCVCVPSGLHGEIVIASAQAGKHVLCEKPLEIKKDKMTQMIKTCREYGVKLGGVFQRRTMKSAIAAKKAIQQGDLGKIVLGDAYLKYYRSQEYYNSAGWRGTWELDGGGALMNQGVHGVDLIQWMVGDVDSIYARADHLVRNIEVEDIAVVSLRYKNGAFGVIEGTTSVYPGEDTTFAIHGDKGTIIFGDEGITRWEIMDKGRPDVESEYALGGSRGAEISYYGHKTIIEDMAHAILENREPMVPGAEARKAVDLILAIYESARMGKEVKV